MALVLDAALIRLGADDVTNPWLRNTNVAGYDQTKIGPQTVVRVAENDYRALVEAINGNTSTAYATSANGLDWSKYASNPVIAATEQAWMLGSGATKAEAAPGCVLWNPALGLWQFFFHGGASSTSTDRKIGYATSPDLTTWTIYASNPVLTPGSTGAWDDAGVADCKVYRDPSTGTLHMLYRGRHTDASGVQQIGHATSTDNGQTWTKDAANPVIANGGAGSADEFAAAGPSLYVDENGRIHCWYIGAAAGDTNHQVLYAYSDDWSTWTKGASPVYSQSATAADYDASIAYVVNTADFGDLLWISMVGTNVSSYPTNPPMRGAIAAMLPKQRASVPSTSGRFFRGTDMLAAPAAQARLDESVWTIAARVKTVRIRDANRFIYQEHAAFNLLVHLWIDTNGKAHAWFRTTTSSVGINELISTTSVDDNQWHDIAFRRNGLSDFDLVVDGAVEASDTTTTEGTDATAVTPYLGYNQTGAKEPLHGTMARFLSFSGTALTNTQITDALDDANFPVTPDVWYDLGSGDPEPDQSGNGNDGTVTGTTVVDASPTAGVQGLGITNDRLADMAFARGRLPVGVGKMPVPDGVID